MEKTSLEDNAIEVSSAGKQTMGTLKAGERIMEALDIADENTAAWVTYNQVTIKFYFLISSFFFFLYLW